MIINTQFYTKYRPRVLLHLYREKTSALSSLVDWCPVDSNIYLVPCTINTEYIKCMAPFVIPGVQNPRRVQQG